MTLRYIPPLNARAWADTMRARLRERLPDLLLDDSDPWTYIADYAAEEMAALVEYANNSLESGVEAVRADIVKAANLLAFDSKEYLHYLVRQLNSDVSYIGYTNRVASSRVISISVAKADYSPLSAEAKTLLATELNNHPDRSIWGIYRINDLNVLRTTLEATYWYFIDSPNPHDEAIAQATAYFERVQEPGVGIYQSEMIEALWIPDVTEDIRIDSPNDLPGNSSIMYVIYQIDLTMVPRGRYDN